MSRDYVKSSSKKKKRTSKTQHQSSPVRRLPWFVFGLITGLSLIFGGQIKEWGNDVLKETAPSLVKKQVAIKEQKKSDVRFDFYTILPEMEVVVPDRKTATITDKSLPKIDQPGTYILQTGSFKAMQDADKLKARLALLGFSPSIQTVTINNKDTWHRVRVGPFDHLDQLNNARLKLSENNIDSVLLKVRTQ
ncbi:MAG: SPOR domain-containing protein [Gammaproteobacteria bacterium]|nr:SPOR domain-containing protein [Gammaproteobacteria bacterium]